MKKALIIFIFFVLALSAATILPEILQDPCVGVDEDQSCFSEFEVVGDEVHIDCFVTLNNPASRVASVSLTALLPGDVSLGLLKEPECPGVDESSGSSVFTVPAEGSAGFHVVFTGEFAGVYGKADRLLPVIRVNAAEKTDMGGSLTYALLKLLVEPGISEEVCPLGDELNTSNMLVDALIPGRFTGQSRQTYLAVLRPDDEKVTMAHALGFYHRYFAVVDGELQTILSEPRCFEADTGCYLVLRSLNQDYLFLCGSATYQDEEERRGGLYDLTDWTRIWPESDDFWLDHSVDIHYGRITVSRLTAEGWQNEYTLYWNEASGTFSQRTD